jgi:hypothetical protein
VHEHRRFDPPVELARAANAQPSLYDDAATDRLAFWAKQAEWLRWEQPDTHQAEAFDAEHRMSDSGSEEKEG